MVKARGTALVAVLLGGALLGGGTPSPTLYQYLHDPDVCDFLTFTR